MRSAISVWKRCDTNLNWALKHDLLELFRRQTGNLEVVVNYNCDVNYNFSWQEHTHSNFKYSSIFWQKMKNVAWKGINYFFNIFLIFIVYLLCIYHPDHWLFCPSLHVRLHRFFLRVFLRKLRDFAPYLCQDRGLQQRRGELQFHFYYRFEMLSQFSNLLLVELKHESLHLRQLFWKQFILQLNQVLITSNKM